MDCVAVKSRMESFVSETLPEGERALVEQHLATCEGCKLEIELVRVCGAAEKPTDSLRSDWGFDRIFGSEAAGEAETRAAVEPSSGTPKSSAETPVPATPSPAASASSAPTYDASRLTTETAAETAAGAAASSPVPKEGPKEVQEPALNWSFDAADARPSVAPPESSLFFAEEALSRDRDVDHRKGSSLRLVLWGAGGLVGAGLLGLSAWMALSAREPNQDRQSIAPTRRVVPVAREIPTSPPQPAASSVTSPINGASESSDGSVPSPASETSAMETPVPAPSAAPSAAPPAARSAAPSAASPAAPSALEVTGESTIAASVGTAPAPLPPVRKTASVAPAKAHAPAAKLAAHTTAAPKPRAEASTPAPKPQQPAPEQPAPEQPAPTLALVSPEPEPSPSPQSTPLPASPAPALASPAPALEAAPQQKPAPQAVPQSVATKETDGIAPAQTATPVETEPLRPIDRLHRATVQAEAHDDLSTLRQLRNSWKTFTQKMGVGPERSRAKREYADCLWAIQSLTGKTQDQRDALQAYREFLLNAPAGGSDSRSISRLRQLEDALSERR